MFKKIIIVLLCFICIGCTDKKSSNDFKKEYEKYNDKYLKLSLENAELMRYSTVSEVNKVIKSGTGVIYVGSPKDNVSRKAIDILLGVAHNTDLKEIYYLDSLDGINGIEDIKDVKMPLMLFVVDGKIETYRVGTIDGKTELTDDEVIEIYNVYSEGVRKVLKDACDESC